MVSISLRPTLAFLFLSPNSPSLSLFLLSTLACARASMYVFIDVTRDSRTQLTARKHRMYREYTSVFRVRLWHPLSAEARVPLEISL